MLALSQDMNQNRPVEARTHVGRFHELFFTLSPRQEGLLNQHHRALFLADRSAYEYYQDMQEKGYFNRVIPVISSKWYKLDSVICNFDSYPYKVKNVCPVSGSFVRVTSPNARSSQAVT